MGVGNGGQGKRAHPLQIFVHGTNIIDKSSKVLFFGVFSLFFGLFFPLPPLPPGRGLVVLLFGLFAIFGPFSVAPSTQKSLHNCYK